MNMLLPMNCNKILFIQQVLKYLPDGDEENNCKEDLRVGFLSP